MDKTAKNKLVINQLSILAFKPIKMNLMNTNASASSRIVLTIVTETYQIAFFKFLKTANKYSVKKFDKPKRTTKNERLSGKPV